MVNKNLFLEVSNSSNLKTMRLFDTSYYYKDEVVENYLVEVLPVGKNTWITFNVKKGFSLTLNSSNLKYKKAIDEDCLIELPDGIYEIKQSVKPNVLTFVHFYHLRVTSLYSLLKQNISNLFAEKCDLSKAEFISFRDRLKDIGEYIEAAKWMVEEEGNKKKGKEMYEFAKLLLEEYTNECKC